MNVNLKLSYLIIALASLLAAVSCSAQTWWNDAWTVRKAIGVRGSAAGAAQGSPVGTAPVLVRLFDGNFTFDSAQENGSDLRFVLADGKTVLPHHIERYDRGLNEALVWVQVPEIQSGVATTLYLYSGNAASPSPSQEAKATYDADTSLVYHFSEASGSPVDVISNSAATSTSLPVAGSLIAGGVRLTGQNPVTIPANPGLAWTAGGSMTWSAWIKPTSLRANRVLYSRREGDRALILGEDGGVPFVEITNQGVRQRSAAGAALAVDVWRFLALTVIGSTATLWLDGESYASVAAALPALSGPSLLGMDDASGAGAQGFNGEVDELQIAKVARSQAWLKFAALHQGTAPDGAKLLSVGSDETNQKTAERAGFLKEHFGIFSDISKSLTADGWAVIVLCSVLALIGGFVAIIKYIYLNKIAQATKLFNAQWEALSGDITALDRADEEALKSLGGALAGRDLQLVRQSPLFHIYHLGAQEIRKRIAGEGEQFSGLSVRSIAAIKARLDGGLVDEEEKLNSHLVFLTLGIAGGPYLGLLGTVIGVMITFAVIAKSGEVEVNSIAPGIAGALLATVAGLAVAIPALFSYSYLNSRITSALNGVRKFIDEFITRIAEAYPSKE